MVNTKWVCPFRLPWVSNWVPRNSIIENYKIKTSVIPSNSHLMEIIKQIPSIGSLPAKECFKNILLGFYFWSEPDFVAMTSEFDMPNIVGVRKFLVTKKWTMTPALFLVFVVLLCFCNGTEIITVSRGENIKQGNFGLSFKLFFQHMTPETQLIRM